jgi:hypothetical protein
MIYVKVTGKRSIEFYFNEQEAEEMLVTLANLHLLDKELSMNCLLSFKKNETKSVINLKKSGDDEVEILSCVVNLKISEESINYAAFKLNEFIKHGFFFPAEFCEFSEVHSGASKMIYFLASSKNAT